MKPPWTPKGSPVANEGGGNCLYHSLAAALLKAEGKKRSDRKLVLTSSAASRRSVRRTRSCGLDKVALMSAGKSQQADATFMDFVTKAAMSGAHRFLLC